MTTTPRSSALRLAAPAGLLLLTGLISVYAWRGANADDATPPPIASQPAAAPESSNAAPTASFSQRAGRIDARNAAQGDSAVFPDIATGLAQLHRGLSTSPVQVAERDRMIAQLDSGHEAETIDPVWAATSEQRLAVASAAPVMVQADLHPQNVSTDCRSRSCRISARFDNSSEARDWADRLLTQMAGTIAQAKVAVLPQPDGSFEVRVYGARRQS